MSVRRVELTFNFSFYETFEKLTSGHCEAHVRRGNIFDNQWLMRLLHFVRNDKLDVFQRALYVTPVSFIFIPSF